MSLHMMLSLLRRHSLIPLLLALQVAMACAILCNVLFLAWQRLEPMLADSGMDEANLILVDNVYSSKGAFSPAQLQAVVLALRQAPGVASVSPAFGLPMVTSGLVDFALQGPTGVKVGTNGYFGEGLVKTLGLKLTAGRDFLPGEYLDWGVGYEGAKQDEAATRPIIITQSLATQLFGSTQPLGQLLSDPGDKQGKTHYQVIGVVAHLLRNQLSLANHGRADNTILVSYRLAGGYMLSFGVRSQPAMRELALAGVRKAVERELRTMMGVDAQPKISFYAERRAAAFKNDRAVLWLFGGVIAAVVVVVLLGIMGLSGFWVQQRTRQIGIHRALGARRGDVLRHFLLENALITAVGIALGMGLAFLGNRLLMAHYELPSLPWGYLPLGALLMLALGQLAVLSPALRASNVPPVVATRSL
ncbi:MAG: FtsX-like permease family protein [Dyella sp.]